MINDVVLLKMPFKRGIMFHEKKVPFLFRIMTLEMTCNDLGVELGDMFSEKNVPIDIYQSLLWNGYLTACMVRFKKPRYPKMRAFYWAEYMSAETRTLLSEEIKKLMTFLKDGVKTKEDQPEEEKKS